MPENHSPADFHTTPFQLFVLRSHTLSPQPLLHFPRHLNHPKPPEHTIDIIHAPDVRKFLGTGDHGVSLLHSGLIGNPHTAPRQGLAVFPARNEQFLCVGAVASSFEGVREWQAGCRVEGVVLEGDDALPQVLLAHVLLHIHHSFLPLPILRHPFCILADLRRLIDTLTVGEISIDGGTAEM